MSDRFERMVGTVRDKRCRVHARTHPLLLFRHGQRQHMKLCGYTREAAKREIHRKIAEADGCTFSYFFSTAVGFDDE